jgi:elongator complex protein 2
MFGEWKRDGLVSWHELARPQIHGYDLNAVSSLNDWKFVSGADEKVVRVFQTSKATADLVNRLAGNLTDTEVYHLRRALMKNLPSTANLPVLGLSNKESSTTDEELSTTLLHTLNTPPLEDHLSRYTLSPELEKLYAHPSEIIALSTSHSSKYIASTCKATTPENAVIRIFNTTNYAEIAILKAHNLTVVKLAWSPNDKFLLSVGRDRQWTLFDTDNWTIVKSCPKAHARIVWDVSFAPLAFGSAFITGSRDKCIKVWSGEGWGCVATVKFAEAVTACEFLGEVVVDKVFVAVGLENGAIYILGCDRGTESWKVMKKFDERCDLLR